MRVAWVALLGLQLVATRMICCPAACDDTGSSPLASGLGTYHSLHGCQAAGGQWVEARQSECPQACCIPELSSVQHCGHAQTRPACGLMRGCRWRGIGGERTALDTSCAEHCGGDVQSGCDLPTLGIVAPASWGGDAPWTMPSQTTLPAQIVAVGSDLQAFGLATDAQGTLLVRTAQLETWSEMLVAESYSTRTVRVVGTAAMGVLVHADGSFRTVHGNPPMVSPPRNITGVVTDVYAGAGGAVLVQDHRVSWWLGADQGVPVRLSAAADEHRYVASIWVSGDDSVVVVEYSDRTAETCHVGLAGTPSYAPTITTRVRGVVPLITGVVLYTDDGRLVQSDGGAVLVHGPDEQVLELGGGGDVLAYSLESALEVHVVTMPELRGGEPGRTVDSGQDARVVVSTDGTVVVEDPDANLKACRGASDWGLVLEEDAEPGQLVELVASGRSVAALYGDGSLRVWDMRQSVVAAQQPSVVIYHVVGVGAVRTGAHRGGINGDSDWLTVRRLDGQGHRISAVDGSGLQMEDVELGARITCWCGPTRSGATCGGCAPGWAGSACELDCDEGCLHGACDEGVTGTGTCRRLEGGAYDCEDGWVGPHCHDCAAGRFGLACEPCPECHNGGMCLSGVLGTGACACEPSVYFAGATCDECGTGLWGSQCSQACHGLELGDTDGAGGPYTGLRVPPRPESGYWLNGELYMDPRYDPSEATPSTWVTIEASSAQRACVRVLNASVAARASEPAQQASVQAAFKVYSVYLGSELPPCTWYDASYLGGCVHGQCDAGVSGLGGCAKDDTGQLACHEHWAPGPSQLCDVCAEGYWGPSCVACGCAAAGTVGCDPWTGACACAVGYDGLKCEGCADGFFRGDAEECVPCSADCGVGAVCAPWTGECAGCPIGVVSVDAKHVTCTSCAEGYMDAGGAEIPTCVQCACHAAGTARATDSGDGVSCWCECIEGHIGAACDECVSPRTMDAAGRCTCPGQYEAGPACDACDPDALAIRSESGQCTPCSDCDPQGTAGCTATAPASYTCECVEGRGDWDCGSCVGTNMFARGATCDVCLCSEQGVDEEVTREGLWCDSRTGQCPCKAGYTGQACDRCDDTHAQHPDTRECVACDPALSGCSGHGVLSIMDGGGCECTCAAGFGGAACGESTDGRA